MSDLTFAISTKHIINFSDVRKVEPFILIDGSEGHYITGYGLKPGTRFCDEYSDERKVNRDTVVFMRNNKWFLRYTYETTSYNEGIEIDHPAESEVEYFEIVNTENIF